MVVLVDVIGLSGIDSLHDVMVSLFGLFVSTRESFLSVRKSFPKVRVSEKVNFSGKVKSGGITDKGGL
jgi:hypothetical protein